MVRHSVFTAIAGALLMALLLTAPARAQDITLRVGNYGGAFTATQKKYAADLFTQRTGVKIQFIDANPADHLAKLIASRGREAPYDVVYLDDDVQAKAIAAGVVEKLDPALVPNLALLYDQAKNKAGYGPGILFYSIGIAYNSDKLKQAGIPEPESWNDLFDPRLAGRVAVPDLSTIMGRDFLMAATHLAGGTEATLGKGIDKIATLKAQSYYTSSATLATLLQAGDVWAAPWINGRAWGMTDRGLPIRFLLPKEGGYGNMTTIDMVKGTKHPKEAQEFINLVLDPLPQLGQANEIPYGPANRLLGPVLAAYPDLAKKSPSSLADIQKLRLVDWTVYNANSDDAVELWNRKVIGR